MSKVSVIVPVYNSERWLGACLDSLLGQTLEDVEVICINDGSTDGSAAILSEYASRDGRVKTFAQENRGLGAARNRGIDAATGDYLHFMDADDEFAAPDALERLVGVADAERTDALFFDAETRVDEGLDVPEAVVRPDDYIRRRDYTAVTTGRALFARFVELREFTASPCLLLLRRSFLERCAIRFPEANVYHEDNIFVTHVLMAADRVSHRPWKCYARKVHDGSIVTSKPTMRHLRGYVACCLDVCRLLSEAGLDRRTKAALLDRRAVYRMHVRRIADGNRELASAAEREMNADEYAAFISALDCPLSEKAANALRCLKDHGLAFTIRRILFGRQG